MAMYQSLGCLGLLLLAVAGDSCPDPACEEVLDIAIIGGGAGGTYSAYKLRKAGLSVGLFEYSDRIGGRLFTHNMAGSNHKVELGGMRFIDNAHTRLQKVISELGLTPIVFKEGFGRPGRSRFYFRETSLTPAEANNGTVPYDLTDEEKAHQDNLWEFFLEKLTGVQLNGLALTREANMALKVVNDGRYLYELSFDEAMDLVASSEAKEFLRDMTVFRSVGNDETSASVAFDYHLGEDGIGGDIYTVDEGMSAIPTGLLQNFLDESSSHKVYKNRQLKTIKARQEDDDRDLCGNYTLTFRKTVTIQGYTGVQSDEDSIKVCARKVILALPRDALMEVNWKSLKKRSVKKSFKAVYACPASKVFLTFDEAWWLNANLSSYHTWVTKSDEMFSQVYDWWTGEDPGPYTLMASYSDLDSSLKERDLWNQSPNMEGSEEGYGHVSFALLEELLDELSEAYGIAREDIPTPLTGVSQFWSGYPFAGGWVMWKKGYNIDQVMENMRKPAAEDVFIVGSDYSWGMMVGWAEGALETVDVLMDNYFRDETGEHRGMNYMKR